MGTVTDVGQKIKGKAQIMKGKIEVKSGNKVDGVIDQVKGTVNETLADIKLKAREQK